MVEVFGGGREGWVVDGIVAAGNVGVAQRVFRIVDPRITSPRIELHSQRLRRSPNGKVSIVVESALWILLAILLMVMQDSPSIEEIGRGQETVCMLGTRTHISKLGSRVNLPPFDLTASHGHSDNGRVRSLLSKGNGVGSNRQGHGHSKGLRCCGLHGFCVKGTKDNFDFV